VGGGVATPTTCCANHCSISSSRQKRRLVRGKRQIGGNALGLRLASERTEATDLNKRAARPSTVTSVDIGGIPSSHAQGAWWSSKFRESRDKNGS
jgi:hypothetical protein